MTLPSFHPASEQLKITQFIKHTVTISKIPNIIVAVSGGIDSATSLNLLCKSLPLSQIYVVHFPYFDGTIPLFRETIDPLHIASDHILLYPINSLVDQFLKEMNISVEETKSENNIRIGNMMARIRMILLYDYAKKYNALVCGTENRSELLLGYFTRFGDAASDLEPISHLYKSQVKELAQHLGVPRKICTVAPTAGLWQDQTDEDELGFTYEEADQVLYLFYDKKIALQSIDTTIFPHAKDIITHAQNMQFKQEVPYHFS